ncbi:ankyrin repeats (3 copies) domain-containing protein [Hirsutella rhossiliensis]|uniref:Ankyrin repeats (3 copies) domain-containing protein n=1 Tax=Hirsutella rhossiliensis TaxID=111463 RepID=A0A9P8MYX5_9HYPO|nr:ankyrin repeats (3 copies) domain-containing protein [Hirsutella rhossiliensis]KAH0962894.1 ankyrin repeats (3 copies) domain-containing protein [Hirsutella rhossiliensis]
MSNPNDYNVGWICAVTTEYVAAQAMLDEKHQGPASVATHDNNDYTLGRIGQHNVVIAVLPLGDFANVRVGLMVGIGGGAPSSKHDIRLGDIVVSTSGGGQCAVGGLKAQYIGEGHQLEETINNLIDKKPRLRKTYSRPGASTDRLYKPGVLHPEKDESGCATTCGDDPSNIVPRHERTEDEDNPAIHYGLIASANRLMKDASIRDSLAASKEVLCFEMEAAGLMNHFPCLVIRGICDYSDTHKNKEWQGYAAMTAAAYAKDLLRRIPRNKIEAERKLGEVLDGLQQGVAHLVHKQRHRDSEAILEWLAPVDYAPQQSDYYGRRQPGTASLLKQLAENQPSLPESVTELYQRHRMMRTRPSMDEVRRALHSLAADLSSSRLFIVIDALDECPASNGCRSQFIENVFQVQNTSRANVFATSRNIPEITDKFKKCISLEIHASDHDVRQYLDGHMYRLPAFAKRDQKLQEEIKNGIVLAVKGMFLLAQLHLDALVGKKSPYAVQIALQNLSTGSNAYDDAYRDAMKRIQGQVEDQKVLAMDVLSWITYALRPLTTSQLQHALATEVGHQDLIRGNISDVEDLVSQYFEREQKNWFPNAEYMIATTCVIYLSFNAFESGICRTREKFDDRLRLYRLYDYAASCWGHHARASSTLPQGVLDFLKSYSLIESAHDIDSKDFEGHTPLYHAARIGHEAVVRLLLDKGASVEVQGQSMAALCWAALNGHESVVRLLLDKGASVEVQGQSATPLCWAALNGHESVVRLLLDKGASVEVQGQSATPLCWAARNGHESVVRLLLDKGASVEVQGQSVAALPWAARNGHESVVRLFLDKGASIEAQGQSATPLCWAALNGHESVVRLLLDKGADIEGKSQNIGWTPLSWAAASGHESVIRLLLDKGADIEGKSQNFSRTPLSFAAENGHESVIRLLLDKGADIEAAMRGIEVAVRLLLDKGANAESRKWSQHRAKE